MELRILGPIEVWTTERRIELNGARAHKLLAALRQALELWRGNALDGIRSRILSSAAIRLDERRLDAVEQCIELELALGRHRGLTGELSALVFEHPLRERFTAQLMLALYRNGRA